MKFGIVLPFGDALTAAKLAAEAEDAGWDGFFLPEAIWHVDAWVSLSAAALKTARIRLGTMVSPLSRMHPWKLASEAATLDNLSNGRLILSLGKGAAFMGYQAFPGITTNPKLMAKLLDEGLDMLDIFFAGEPRDYNGDHYQLRLTDLDPVYYPPPPVQQPGPLTWIVGAWPKRKPLDRALRYDGLIPLHISKTGEYLPLDLKTLGEIKAFVDGKNLERAFDLVIEGKTIGMDHRQAMDVVHPWEHAGATWWIETLYDVPQDEFVARLRLGPPV